MEEFNVLDFLKYYLSKLAIVIVFVIIGILASFYYTEKIQVATYKSETKIVLTNQSTSSATITQSDITLNKNLISTYREIIKSRRILLKVINTNKLDI